MLYVVQTFRKVLINAYKDILGEIHLYNLKKSLAYKLSSEVISIFTTHLFGKSVLKGIAKFNEAFKISKQASMTESITSVLSIDTAKQVVKAIYAAVALEKAIYYSNLSMEHMKNFTCIPDAYLPLLYLEKASNYLAQALLASQDAIDNCNYFADKNFIERSLRHSWEVLKGTVSSTLEKIGDAILPGAFASLTKSTPYDTALLSEFEAYCASILTTKALKIVELEKLATDKSLWPKSLTLHGEQDSTVKTYAIIREGIEELPTVFSD